MYENDKFKLVVGVITVIIFGVLYTSFLQEVIATKTSGLIERIVYAILLGVTFTVTDKCYDKFKKK